MWWSNGLSPGGGVRVEQAALAAGGHRHADRVGDALAERPGGRLDAGVWPCSGWPGVLLPQVRSDLRSSSSRPKPAEEQLDVEGEAECARHDSTNRSRPTQFGVGGVVPHHLLEEQVGRPGPGSSRCRGGRCRPSAPRPWRARGRCPRPAGRGRSMSSLLTSGASSPQGAGGVRCGPSTTSAPGPSLLSIGDQVHTVPPPPDTPSALSRIRLAHARCASTPDAPSADEPRGARDRRRPAVCPCRTQATGRASAA